MRSISFGITLILLFSIGFSGETEYQTDILGEWKVVSITDLITGKDSCPPIEEKDAYFITFSQDSFTGITSRNEYWGTYSISVNNNLSTTLFGTTKVLETDWGQRYYQAFRYLEEAPISLSGNKLSLSRKDSCKLNYIRLETGLLIPSVGLQDKDIVLYVKNSFTKISIPCDFPVKKSRISFFRVNGERITTIPFQIKNNRTFIFPKYVSHGVYFIFIDTGNTHLSRKLIIYK